MLFAQYTSISSMLSLSKAVWGLSLSCITDRNRQWLQLKISYQFWIPRLYSFKPSNCPYKHMSTYADFDLYYQFTSSVLQFFYTIVGLFRVRFNVHTRIPHISHSTLNYVASNLDVQQPNIFGSHCMLGSNEYTLVVFLHINHFGGLFGLASVLFVVVY